MTKEEIYKAALDKWGKDAQQDMVIEEMSELTKEICKHKRGADNRQEIAQETADVMIMLEQFVRMHGLEGDLHVHFSLKLKRLENIVGGKK